MARHRQEVACCDPGIGGARSEQSPDDPTTPLQSTGIELDDAHAGRVTMKREIAAPREGQPAPELDAAPPQSVVRGYSPPAHFGPPRVRRPHPVARDRLRPARRRIPVSPAERSSWTPPPDGDPTRHQQRIANASAVEQQTTCRSRSPPAAAHERATRIRPAPSSARRAPLPPSAASRGPLGGTPGRHAGGPGLSARRGSRSRPSCPAPRRAPGLRDPSSCRGRAWPSPSSAGSSRG